MTSRFFSTRRQPWMRSVSWSGWLTAPRELRVHRGVAGAQDRIDDVGRDRLLERTARLAHGEDELTLATVDAGDGDGVLRRAGPREEVLAAGVVATVATDVELEDVGH